VPLPPLGLEFLTMLMFLNLGLVAFNLVPAFPMDGGRVLRALLALRLGQLRATQIAVNIGMVLAVLMGVVGILVTGNFMMVFLAVFVYFAGQQELAALYQREAQRRWQQGYDRFESYAEPPAGPQPADNNVYLWDSKNGVWVPQKPLRPARHYWFEAE